MPTGENPFSNGITTELRRALPGEIASGWGDAGGAASVVVSVLIGGVESGRGVVRGRIRVGRLEIREVGWSQPVAVRAPCPPQRSTRRNPFVECSSETRRTDGACSRFEALGLRRSEKADIISKYWVKFHIIVDRSSAYAVQGS